MVSSSTRNWLQSLGKRSITELHYSLCCKSKIAALIKTEMRALCPEGRDWNGKIIISFINVY